MVKVLKFGGSCIEKMDRIWRILKEEKEEKIVVVSALPEVTDELYISFPSRDVEGLRERHIAMIERMDIGEEDKKAMILRMEQMLLNAKRAESMDAFVSYGERLSAMLLERYLNSKGMRATVLESDSLPLITDRSGEILLEECTSVKKRIKEEIMKGSIPIITGYFGIDEKGSIKTLGRGGSDYTASAIAYLTDAEAVELWKDTQGFMSADPKIVKEAHLIEELSYEEAAELAHYGAKILHPRAIEPAVKKGIRIFIKNIDNHSAKGTLISDKTGEKAKIRAISCRKGVKILKFSIHGLAYTRIPGKIIDDHYRKGDLIYAISTSQASLALLVDEDCEERAEEIKPIRIENVALIATVGYDIGITPGISADVFLSMKKEGINILMISEGASDSAINFVVAGEECDRAVKALHRDLIEVKNGNE
jgi:aspartate kinase